MKLASPAAMQLSGPTSPPDPCEHKRARLRFGRVRCPDCLERIVSDEEEFMNQTDHKIILDLTPPLVAKAYEFGRKAHESIDQRRKYSGDPYFDAHVVEVAIITQEYLDRADWMKYQWAITAALLHDVVEDVAPQKLEFGLGRITSEFGHEVAKIVEGLTDVFTGPKYRGFNRASRKLMEAGRIHLAGRHNELGRLVHTIKVADLIQNTQSIVSQDAEFAEVYLNEKRTLLQLLDAADPRILARAHAQIA